jgi:hypothetical protein
MVFAMLERKMRPASWTVPMAKGMEENKTKLSWWMSDEKITSLDSAFMYGWKTGWLKMTAEYPYNPGTLMITLT